MCLTLKHKIIKDTISNYINLITCALNFKYKGKIYFQKCNHYIIDEVPITIIITMKFLSHNKIGKKQHFFQFIMESAMRLFLFFLF